MKRKIIILLLIIIHFFSFGQIKGIVVDYKTKKTIPYVNIWIQNTIYGTSSNKNGYFEIEKEKNKTNYIIFSAVGYNEVKIKSTLLPDTIFLKHQITEIPEIIISANKVKKEQIIGKLKHQFPSYRIGSGSGKNPYISAIFIPYKEEYKETPFLKSIEFLTHSNINNAKFNIRFYLADKNNKPNQYLVNKNIIGIAKRGARKTKIDLSPYNIIFPKEGLYIAIEWLIIEENKHTYNYTIKGSKKKYKDGVEYMPSFSAFRVEDSAYVWEYYKGNWKHILASDNLYYLLQMKITLTN